MNYRELFPLVVTAYPALSYLDNAATTQKPQTVINRMNLFYTTENSNVHRGAYALSERTTVLYEDARQTVQKFVGAKRREEIIFTRGTTESINLVANSWGTANIKAGDEIIVTILEHHSNFLPWQQLAKKTGAILKVAHLNESVVIASESVKKLLSPKTKLVALAQVSNVLGCVSPIKEITAAAHAVGACILVDAAQSIAHMAIDVADLDADWLAASGHKMYGPTGIGILYGKYALLEKMPPYLLGGGMISEVSLNSYEPADLPDKFEAGTPPIAEAVGLGEAVKFIERIGWENIQNHERELMSYAVEKLLTIPAVTIIGSKDPALRQSVISFMIKGVHAHDVASILGAHNVAVRAGHHCAEPLHTHLGLTATARASFALYSTHDDIDRLCEGIAEIKKTFKL